MNTIKNMYQDWEYRLWTEDNLPTLINSEIYKAETRNHTKSNLIRYEIIYSYGGIYIDSDMEALKKLEDNFLMEDFFACYESEKYVPGLIPSCFFGATPKHPILKDCIDNMKYQDQSKHSWLFNGTQYFTDTINKYKVKIHPSYICNPVHFRDKDIDQERMQKAYFDHHWGTTRKKWKTKLL
jgi:mannosyltransferase OCH1-like enzyme